MKLAAFLVVIAIAAAFGTTVPLAAQTDKSPRQAQTTGPTDSDSGPDAQAVLVRTEELNQAFLHADLAALDRIIADDCVQITKDGAATKGEWLAPYRSGAKRFDGTNPKPPEWRRIRLYGDVAVVTSAGEISMVVQGEPRTYRLFNTRTWVKRAGQWYLVLAQNTLRAEQESKTK